MLFFKCLNIFLYSYDLKDKKENIKIDKLCNFDELVIINYLSLLNESWIINERDLEILMSISHIYLRYPNDLYYVNCLWNVLNYYTLIYILLSIYLNEISIYKSIDFSLFSNLNYNTILTFHHHFVILTRVSGPAFKNYSRHTKLQYFNDVKM